MPTPPPREMSSWGAHGRGVRAGQRVHRHATRPAGPAAGQPHPRGTGRWAQHHGPTGQPPPDPERRREPYELYLRRIDRINDWDLVDLSAHQVIGGYLLDKPRDVLYQLARSPRW
jgi:hypothetical protein